MTVTLACILIWAQAYIKKKKQQIVIKPGEKPQGIIKSLQSEQTNKKTGMMKNNLYEQRRSRNE